MKIQLEEYTGQHKEQVVAWMADFFGFHEGLVRGSYTLTQVRCRLAEETLEEWLHQSGKVYVIDRDGEATGFLRIAFRGPNVAWIEDIFVAPQWRNQGVATRAIRAAEEIIKETPGYTAICMDVAPRNREALRLYQKLGYDTLSIVTLRKELDGSKYEKELSIEETQLHY